jgi:hypothetical protein
MEIEGASCAVLQTEYREDMDGRTDNKEREQKNRKVNIKERMDKEGTTKYSLGS